ncbi:hypothetical protein C6401_07975 [Arthrobacter woluwensis]|uniref:hypothetical protein n=1 Tax=Arthrobacter woluwensis TaxID=156980 RepID=UPI000D12C98D|nr:hypothetical protein [Arthrobacter woluwensis]PSS44100.1 hypothetical protein C6401_07975 [Arthrobacter woluwensis]
MVRVVEASGLAGREDDAGNQRQHGQGTQADGAPHGGGVRVRDLAPDRQGARESGVAGVQPGVEAALGEALRDQCHPVQQDESGDPARAHREDAEGA